MPSMDGKYNWRNWNGLDANQVKTNFSTLYNNLKGNASFLFRPLSAN